MPKTNAQPIAALAKTENRLSTPWSSHEAGDVAHIHAYVEGLNEWMAVAETKAAGSVSAAAIAAQIVATVNDAERIRALMVEMAAALEACLDCGGLDFTAEHDGEIALGKFREMVKSF